MAGFATLAAVRAAIASEGYHRAEFIDVLGGQAVNVWTSLFLATGIPGPGTHPAAGLAGAAAVSKATTGAIPFENKAAGTTLHLATAAINKNSVSVSSAPGMLLLIDRLAHANVSIVQATGAFAPVIDGTARLAAGEGALIFAEVTTALSAAANTFSLTYTNQAGTAGQVTATMTTVASAVVNRTPWASYFTIPLAAGDTGARTITNWTLVSGTATGNITISLIKPLLWIPVFPLIATPHERDYFMQYFHLRDVNDQAYLQLLANWSSAGAVGSTSGLFRLIQK